MSRVFLPVWLILLMCVFPGCANSVKTGSTAVISENTSQNQAKNKLPDKDANIQEEEKATLQLYFADAEETMLRPEERIVNRKDVLADAPRVIIEELMKGPKNKNLIPTIPKDTKLLSVKKENDTVTVNFSKEFRDNHNGGSAGETNTIYSIVNSLTELKDVNKVAFQIEGKVEEEFKGHYEFDKPFVRDESLIVK